MLWFIFSSHLCDAQAKLRSNSHITDDEADLSDAGSSQQTSNASPAESAPATRPTSILERALMATRSKIVRSPIIIKEVIQGAINMKFQPMVCVQKISDKDLPQKSWPISTVTQPLPVAATSAHGRIDAGAGSVSASVSANASADEDDDEIDDDEESADDADTDGARAGSSQTTISPKTKSSPRKLRKPRGRYYRD